MSVPSRSKAPRGGVAFAAAAIAAFACAATLPAQDQPPPNRFVPKDACFVLRLAAPATWRTRFASTQLARLFEERTLAPLVEQGKQAFEHGMRQLRESGAADADLVERLVTEYTGEVVVALQLDADKLFESVSSGEPPPLALVVALRPDGSYPLDALAENLAKVAESEAGADEPLRDLQVGDHRLRIGGDEQLQYSVPAMVDGHLVVLIGTRLEESARVLLDSEGRMDAAATGRGELQVQLRLKALIHGAIQALKAGIESGGGPPIDPEQVFGALGFGALDALDLSVGAEDDRVAMAATVAIDGEPGLFGSVLVDQGTPRLLRYVPAGCDSFSVMAFDVNALWRAVGAVWGSVEALVPMTFEQVQQMAAEQLKVRLQEDLLAHVGTELLTVQDVAAAMSPPADEDDPAAAFAGTCLALRLRDGKAFGTSLETALRARGLHAARKTEEYQGTNVHRLRLGGLVEIEYAVTDDLLVIGLGEDEGTRRNLRGILDARAAGAEPSLPESVQDAVKTLPAGWSGLGVTPIADILVGIQHAAQGVAEMGEAPPEVEQMLHALDVLGGVAADLKRLGLQHMVTATYTTRRSMTSRARW